MGAVVLFDGVCNFCDASVNFIVDRDRQGYFRFAPLQSDAGKALASKYGVTFSTREQTNDGDTIPIDSVILIEDDRAYTHSTAALGIVRRLGGFWSLLYAFIVVPAPIRDFFYRLFARYRYRIFGRKNECVLPSPEVRTRFLS